MSLNPHVRAARDFLLQHRTSYEVAAGGFRWPELPVYNFATEWFDGLAEENPDGIALWVIDGDEETKLTFAELAARSVATAHLLADLGLKRGDRLLMVLGNCVPLWELMLGAIRLGAVIIPATPQLSATDLADRVERGEARLLVAAGAEADRFAHLDLELGKLAVGCSEDAPTPEGWVDYRRAYEFLGADAHLVWITPESRSRLAI